MTDTVWLKRIIMSYWLELNNLNPMKKCDKICFTKVEAETALNQIQTKFRKKYRKECRIYPCPCGYWHMTSKMEGIKESEANLYHLDKWKKILNKNRDEKNSFNDPPNQFVIGRMCVNGENNIVRCRGESNNPTTTQKLEKTSNKTSSYNCLQEA